MEKRFYLAPKFLFLVLWDMLLVLVIFWLSNKIIIDLFKTANTRFISYIVIGLLSLAVILYLFKFLSYNLTLREGKIVEKGFFSKHRNLSLADINSVNTNKVPGPFRSLLFSPRPMETPEIVGFNLTNDMANPFPAYPISLKLLEAINKVAPSIGNDFPKVVYLFLLHLVVLPIIAFCFFMVPLLALSYLFVS